MPLLKSLSSFFSRSKGEALPVPLLPAGTYSGRVEAVKVLPDGTCEFIFKMDKGPRIAVYDRAYPLSPFEDTQ